MCNCGKKRANYSSSNNLPKEGAVEIRLIGRSALKVIGEITGRTYVFRRRGASYWVDEKDLEGIKNMDGIQVIS